MKKASQIISFLMLLILCLIFLTGCYDAKSIENYAYVIGIAIDKGDSQNIKLSVQIANSSASEGGSSSQSTKSNIISVDCSNIPSGISIINNYSTKKLNLSHCTVIVFSEEISKDGVQDYINTLIDNVEIRPTCNVIISKSEASDFLSAATNSGEEFSSRYYEYILSSSDTTGFTTETTLSDFFSGLKETPYAPIAIYADVTDGNIQNTGLAVFKEDKYISNIGTLENIDYLLIKNKLDSTTVSIENPYNKNEKIPIRISLGGKTKIDIDLVNNLPFIRINISVDGQILSSSIKNVEYLDSETMNAVENSLNNYLEKNIETFLYKTSKDFNSDICNFGYILRKKYLTKDDFDMIHWIDIYKSSAFKVVVNSSISSNYTLINR